MRRKSEGTLRRWKKRLKEIYNSRYFRRKTEERARIRGKPLLEIIKERQRKNETKANAHQARTQFVFLVAGMGKKRKGGRDCSPNRLSSFQGEGGAKKGEVTED